MVMEHRRGGSAPRHPRCPTRPQADAAMQGKAQKSSGGATAAAAASDDGGAAVLL